MCLLPTARRAFTLIELLVVIAIVALLVALLMPAIHNARESARRSECTNRMKQIGIGLHTYHESHRCFPPGYVDITTSNADWGWGALLMPFMELDGLYNSSVTDFPTMQAAINDPPTRVLLQTTIPQYYCPSDQAEGTVGSANLNIGGQSLVLTSYVANNGSGTAFVPSDGQNLSSNGVFWRNSRCTLGDLTDGASLTLMVGERTAALLYSLPLDGVNRESISLGAEGSSIIGVHGTGNNRRQQTIFGISGHGINLVIPDPAFPPYGRIYPCKTGYASPHSGRGANMTFCDGRVKFIADSIDGDLFDRLAQRADGQVTGGEGI